MSTLNVNAIQNLSGVEKYLPITWVNFDGVLGGVIRSSGNVSSIADNGVGDYTVSFIQSYVDLVYAPTGSWGRTTLSDRASQDGQMVVRSIQTASYQIWLATGAADARDGDQVCLNIMR